MPRPPFTKERFLISLNPPEAPRYFSRYHDKTSNNSHSLSSNTNIIYLHHTSTSTYTNPRPPFLNISCRTRHPVTPDPSRRNTQRRSLQPMIYSSLQVQLSDPYTVRFFNASETDSRLSCYSCITCYTIDVRYSTLPSQILEYAENTLKSAMKVMGFSLSTIGFRCVF